MLKSYIKYVGIVGVDNMGKFIPPKRKMPWMMTLDDLTPEQQENAKRNLEDQKERYKKMREMEAKKTSIMVNTNDRKPSKKQ